MQSKFFFREINFTKNFVKMNFTKWLIVPLLLFHRYHLVQMNGVSTCQTMQFGLFWMIQPLKKIQQKKNARKQDYLWQIQIPLLQLQYKNFQVCTYYLTKIHFLKILFYFLFYKNKYKNIINPTFFKGVKWLVLYQKIQEYCLDPQTILDVITKSMTELLIRVQ